MIWKAGVNERALKAANGFTAFAEDSDGRVGYVARVFSRKGWAQAGTAQWGLDKIAALSRCVNAYDAEAIIHWEQRGL